MDDSDTELDYGQPRVYNTTPLRRTAEVASRLGISNEAVAKVLSCYNMDLGNGVIVTEKKVRCQKSTVYDEAIEKRKGMEAPGKTYFPSFK